MENIIKGDKVLNTNTNTEYVVESVETYGDITVVFTEGDKCDCLPISEIIKIPQSWLSNFLLKILNNDHISDIEEKKFCESLPNLNFVTCKPYNPGDLARWMKESK